MPIFRWLKKNTKLPRKRFLHRAHIFWKYHRHRSEKEPAFILTTRRTGSNLLLDYLNSVPGVSFAPEILNESMYYGLPSRGVPKKAALRHIRHSVNASPQRVCGAKFVAVHLRKHMITPEDLLELYPQARFIVLYRRSLLEQWVSLKIAEKTDVWQWTKNFKPPLHIRVEPEEFKEYCRSAKAFYASLLRYRFYGRWTVLSYEDLVEDPQGVFNDSLFPFLGCARARVHSRMVKQNTRALRAVIENYEEIAPWAHHPLARQEYSARRKSAPDRAARVA